MARRLTVVLALAAGLLRPAFVEASALTLTDYNLGNAHFLDNTVEGGGPFAAHSSDGPLGAADFVTFCLEFNEHFSYGGTYNYALSDGAVSGGVAGQTLPNFDPLSDATKWLYYEVISGAYASTGMYAAATGLGLSGNVGAQFQYAFWYLEEERTAEQIGGASSPGYQLATYALANQNWDTLFAAGNRVYALNLTDANGGQHQDQLAFQFVQETRQDIIPNPEPTSVALLGTGLLIAWRRRRSSRR